MHPRHLLTTLLLTLVVVAANGCAKGTYLEVHFSSTGGLTEMQALALDLTLSSADGGVGHSRDVIKGPIKLPASLAFKLDSENGSLTVDATALDAQNQSLATGSGTTQIMPGQTWDITIDLGT